MRAAALSDWLETSSDLLKQLLRPTELSHKPQREVCCAPANQRQLPIHLFHRRILSLSKYLAYLLDRYIQLDRISREVVERDRDKKKGLV